MSQNESRRYYVQRSPYKIEYLEKHTFIEIYSKIETNSLLEDNRDHPFKNGACIFL